MRGEGRWLRPQHLSIPSLPTIDPQDLNNGRVSAPCIEFQYRLPVRLMVVRFGLYRYNPCHYWGRKQRGVTITSWHVLDIKEERKKAGE